MIYRPSAQNALQNKPLRIDLAVEISKLKNKSQGDLQKSDFQVSLQNSLAKSFNM